jgi:hypothetical protein
MSAGKQWLSQNDITAYQYTMLLNRYSYFTDSAKSEALCHPNFTSVLKNSLSMEDNLL